MQGFRHIWGQLTFGGVFDRFPKLKVVFVEGGICWVASMLHDADMIYNSFPTVMNPKLAHPPSWYWFNHCYATFMTDPAGLELLHRIGADRVMWSSDYPHQESTFGYTPQRHPGRVRRHHGRERPEDPRQDRARAVRHALNMLKPSRLKLFPLRGKAARSEHSEGVADGGAPSPDRPAPIGDACCARRAAFPQGGRVTHLVEFTMP